MDGIRQFWSTFWQKIKVTYNKILRRDLSDKKSVGYGETDKINLLAIAVNKITNLSMIEATYEVISDSSIVDRLKELCKNLEDKRFKITNEMLGYGDYVVFPATNKKGDIFHSFVDAEHFVISETDGEELMEIYGVLDEYNDTRGNFYKLVRHHKLAPDGDLLVEIFTVNKNWERVTLPEWKNKEIKVVYKNAEHIGIGHYKSPIMSRGRDSVYGKPLNYGCGEIECKIINDINNRDNEMNNGKSIIFADERIVEQSKGNGYSINENIFPKKIIAGQGGNDIDIYNPNLRISEYNSKLAEDLSLYESQLGFSKGMLTDANPTNSATATEINVSNASTISLLNNIQNAVDKGNIETLKADCVFLNISFDLWEYKSDYYNPFENPQAQFERLSSAIDKGAVEVEDMTKWLFPKLSEEEIAEKLTKIQEKKSIDTEAAINRALGGA